MGKSALVYSPFQVMGSGCGGEGVVEKMGKETSETGTGESLYILIVRPCRKQRSPKQDMFSNDNSDSKHSSHI